MINSFITLLLLVAFSNTAIAARDDQTGDCIRKGKCRDMSPVNVPDCIK